MQIFENSLDRNNNLQDKDIQPNKFIIVFVDRTECFYIRWLKRGFRHCFVIIQYDDHLIICDPLKNKIEISSINIINQFDICQFYHRIGHNVLVGDFIISGKFRFSMPEIITCVVTVKRIIGLRKLRVITPWQLFKYLKKNNSYSTLL